MLYFINDKEYPYDSRQLFRELAACGVNTNCDALGNIDGSPVLGELVRDAYGRAFSSAEGQALCNALGGAEDPRWLAYREVRLEPIRRARAQRYKEETDPLFLKAWEYEDEQERAFALDAWRAAKNAIRAELPYPE